MKGVESKISQAVYNSFEMIENQEGTYGCDLHSELFNSSSAYIWVAEAETDLDELGVFNCLKLVKQYEELHFGKMHTEIEPCAIANMTVYVIGECLLQQSQRLQNECWNRQLTHDDIEVIKAEIETFLQGLNEDLSNIAFDEYGV